MARNLIAVSLIVVGLLGLLYGGFTYTRDKKVVDIGSVQITRQEHERVPISPIIGVVVLVSGVWLLMSGKHA
ncbi:MAG TPA: hypothetical protein VF456_21000 [Vicinamibacterales bacterium]|jgi:uncharacterized membrane protein YidH (DUF202 family)